MRASFVLVCLVGLVAPALGQSNYAVVTGTVTDSQSLAVAGAMVQFRALGTGAIRVITTNDQGLFYAPALLPDDYELSTNATGFAPVTQTLRLEVGEKLAIENPLRVRAVHEGVQVN